jgi:hypothetical protein
MVSIVLMAVIGTTFLVFFKSSLFSYLNLQSDATNMTQLNTQGMRVATVVRGITGINSAAASDLSIYSYFYPSDTYVSLVHYYLQTTGSITKVLADVTPMTANPPTGTPITASKKTYTIIASFYQPTGGTLFTYLDFSGNPLTLPITDLQTIKAIQVNLAVKDSAGTNQALNVQVNLRNRKTNL